MIEPGTECNGLPAAEISNMDIRLGRHRIAGGLERACGEHRPAPDGVRGRTWSLSCLADLPGWRAGELAGWRAGGDRNSAISHRPV
jgi:hypothetical protein